MFAATIWDFETYICVEPGFGTFLFLKRNGMIRDRRDRALGMGDVGCGVLFPEA